jgi:toxin ParE1/3/4
MRNFKSSLLADEDLLQSFIYGIETWGEEQALQYKRELEEGRDRILENPYLVNSKRRDDIVEGCRSYRVNHYYFFYKVNESEENIFIARILQETMNFPEHIREEYFPHS